MATGKLCDTNLTRTAAFDGPGFLRLENLAADDRYIEDPAICLDSSTLEGSRFEVTLAQPRLVNLVALLFHTMGFGSRFQVKLAGLDLDLDNPVYVSGWRPVFSTFYPHGTIPFGEENWFSGQVAPSEIDLYPRHRWLDVDPVIVGKVGIELDDRLSETTFFHLGGLLIAPTITTRINYSRGRDLTLAPRSLIAEGPSGRRVAESRQPRRQLALDWSMLTTNEAYRFIDAGMRARNDRPVFFLPDSQDEIALMREAFPATFEKPPGARFNYPTTNGSAVVLQEILA